MAISLGRALSAVTMLAVAGSCAVASAKTVSYDNVVSPSKLISCAAVLQSTEIECTAPSVPDVGDLDSYYALKPRGKAILSQRGDFPGSASPRRTLRYGDVWTRTGIRCTLARSGLTCRNRDGHGFHIAKGDTHRF